MLEIANKKYLTTLEASKLMKISLQTCRKLVADGVLLSHKIGRTSYVSESSINNYFTINFKENQND